MKHAGPPTLLRLAPLLSQLRTLAGLVERRPGCFYRRSQAFLHFHEDPSGLFADARLAGAGTGATGVAAEDFSRYPVSTPAQQAALLARLRATLNPPPASGDQTTAPAQDGPASR